MNQLVNNCRICLQIINHEPIKINRLINEFLEKQLLLPNICRIDNNINNKCFLCAKCFNRLSDIYEFYEYCLEIDKYWQKIFDKQEKFASKNEPVKDQRMKEIEFLEINSKDSLYIEYQNIDENPGAAIVVQQHDKDQQFQPYSSNSKRKKIVQTSRKDSLTALKENVECIETFKQTDTNFPKSIEINEDHYFMEPAESIDDERTFTEITYYEENGPILKPIRSEDIIEMIMIQENDYEHTDNMNEHYILLEDSNKTEPKVSEKFSDQSDPNKILVNNEKLTVETYESGIDDQTPASFLVLSSDEDDDKYSSLSFVENANTNSRILKDCSDTKNSAILQNCYKILSNEETENGNVSRKQYQCLTCEKQFDRLCDLETHLNIHNNLKPFICHICGRGFRQKNILTTHQTAIHYGKKIECPDCGKKFSRRSQLILHNRMHLNEKPFQCDFENCSAAFRQRQHLMDHKNIHTDTKSFICRICSKSFHMRRRLQDHLYKVHSNHRYRCNICSKNFLKPHMLKNHFSSVHKIEIADVSHLRTILEN